MQEEPKISQAVIERLPRYLRYLGDLRDQGVERISSRDLSVLMKSTASQIRQDFNLFGEFGQQGYGYNVNLLYSEIGRILGLDKEHRLIIIGAGHLGQALANYSNFESRGFLFKGIFDNDSSLTGKRIANMTVRPMEELVIFISDNDIDIAVLTIPRTAAVPVSRILVDAGIKAIWNFAHADLPVPEGILVENVHLTDSLMRLSYLLSSRAGKE